MKNGKLRDKEPQIFDEEILEKLEAEDDTLGRATFNMAASETCDANDR